MLKRVVFQLFAKPPRGVPVVELYHSTVVGWSRRRGGVVRTTSKVVHLFPRKYPKFGQLPSRINFAIFAKSCAKSDFYVTFLNNFHFCRKNIAKTTFYIGKNVDNFQSCPRAQSRGQLLSGGQLPPAY